MPKKEECKGMVRQWRVYERDFIRINKEIGQNRNRLTYVGCHKFMVENVLVANIFYCHKIYIKLTIFAVFKYAVLWHYYIHVVLPLSPLAISRTFLSSVTEILYPLK